MENLVAIIGRPNVGKSTLYNKIIGKKVSIVDDQPGVTRDRLYNFGTWLNNNFQIIDTGGIQIKNKTYQEQIQIQAKIAINEAKVIIFVLDGRVGFTKDDEYILKILQKTNKPIIVAANKLEGNKEFEDSIYLAGQRIFKISAMHGEGVGDLLDKVVSHLNFNENKKIEKHFKISIIGRPNVGKSSLLNAILNDERSIVSPIKNTTRDSVNSNFKIGEQIFTFYDTAGINKKSKLVSSIEHYALSRAINSIENSQITLLIIDVNSELSHFDSVVGGFAYKNNKPIIIVVNKWDLAKKDTNSMKNFENNLRKKFKFLSWAPIEFISALKKQRLDKLLKKIILVKNNLEKTIKTSLINQLLIDLQMMQSAPSYKGGRLQIIFGKQIKNKIPTFTLFVNNKKYLHFSYKRYIENQFREYFNFEGTPIILLFRNKNKKGDDFNER